MTNPDPIRLRIVAIDPPFGEGHGVLFGMQTNLDIHDPLPASATTTFDLEISVATAEPEGYDFKGRFVHGRKGDRFLYLSWGRARNGEPFEMFARSKLKLSDIPIDLVGSAIANGSRLVCEVQATNHKGQPATGSIRPPAIAWSLA